MPPTSPRSTRSRAAATAAAKAGDKAAGQVCLRGPCETAEGGVAARRCPCARLRVLSLTAARR